MNEEQINNQEEVSEGPNPEENKLEEALKERDEYLDGWKRAKADLINYKKEEIARLTEISRFGNADLIRDLISVLDSFDLGLATLEKEGKSEKGFYMIRVQLEDALKRRGLERISVSVGQKFDPMVHESVANIESDLEEGTVVEEVEKGYLLYGKLLRPSRVKVAIKKEA